MTKQKAITPSCQMGWDHAGLASHVSENITVRRVKDSFESELRSLINYDREKTEDKPNEINLPS